MNLEFIRVSVIVCCLQIIDVRHSKGVKGGRGKVTYKVRFFNDALNQVVEVSQTDVRKYEPEPPELSMDPLLSIMCVLWRCGIMV